PASSIAIYPNPANDKVTVTTMLSEESVLSFELIDVTGRCVMTTREYVSVSGNHQTLLNVSNLADGLYMLSIQIESKGKSEKFSLKLIIR
ncbi:MAG: hypothetical protein CVU06_10610, partial [Bacteroidetes bacterium HGW-Bacteroidetes-22]